MHEIWKPIAGYEDRYEVSNLGRIKSLKYNRIMSPQERQHGYLGVMLYGQGGHPKRGCKTHSVHRLVAEAFVPNPNGLPEVNHIDENKQNNVASNLEWVTHKENSTHGTRRERIGEKHYNAVRKPVVQQTVDGVDIAVFPNARAAERATRACYGGISNCCHGKQETSGGYKWRFATAE